MVDLPKYEELPLLEGTNERHAWNIWGKDDQLGMVNLLTPERVLRATRLVKKGKIITIEPSRDLPTAHMKPGQVYEHHMRTVEDRVNDTTVVQPGEVVSGFPLHGGMGHLDGLRHMRYRQFGYYGGRQETDLADGHMLSLQNVARHGVVGRGVLLDVIGYMERHNRPMPPDQPFSITPDLLEAVAEEERVGFEPGDLMLIRTGWRRWYANLPEERRSRLEIHPGEGGMDCPGLDRTQETAAWLWDHHFCWLLGDNHAVEQMRILGSDFQHRRILAMFGMYIGEYMDFEELAADCGEDGVYEFMITLKPLNLPGGSGSPANAYVIK